MVLMSSLLIYRYCGFVRGLMYYFICSDVMMKSRVKNLICIVFSVKFCTDWYQIHLTSLFLARYLLITKADIMVNKS